MPHDLLLTKLHRHGISGTALRWFEGYLSNRQQRVVLEGTFSDWLPITSGVPQGSILGPLLFLVFANDMPSYVQHGSSLALFADDSKLYRPLASVSSSALLQSGLDGLHSWSSDHRMTFNTTKCKVLRMSKKDLVESLLIHITLARKYYRALQKPLIWAYLSLVTAHGLVISSRCVQRRIGYLV